MVLFTIKKLFRKYDITIKLDEKCAILLGANGIGKTTALKILFYYLTENYVDIISAPFDALVFVNDEGSYEVSYEELLPSDNYVIDLYMERLRREEYDRSPEDKYNESQFGSRKTVEQLTEEFRVAIQQIKQVNRYGEFIYSLYKKRPFPNIVQQILKKYVNMKNLSQIEITTVWAGMLVFHKAPIDGLGLLGKIPYREKREICVFFDAVENYKISNDLCYSSVYFDPDLEWIYSDVNAAAGNPDTVKRAFIKHYRRKEEIDQQLATTEPSRNVNIHRDKDSIFDDLSRDKVLRLNELINRNYYPIDLVFDINNRISKYVEEYYETIDEYPIDREIFYSFDEYDENEYQIYKVVQEFYTDEVIRDYQEYVKPILIRHNFFDIILQENSHDDFDVVNLKLSLDLFIHKMLKKKLLMDFLNEVLPILKDKKNRNPVVAQYEGLVRRYLADKYVEVKPCGIQIRGGAALSHNENRLFVLFDKDDIDLSIISSGERKILMIFAVALFGEGSLFLDEPELSLSLIWQENILPDILRHGKLKNIFVATHSPYISRAEELDKYLTFLPQRDM